MTCVFAVCGFVNIASSQTRPAPEFDVVSLKPSPPPTAGRPSLPRLQGGPGTASPTRITYRNIPMAMLLIGAYNINSADVVGPDWATHVDYMSPADKFDIDATLPAGTSTEQFHLMLQNLLADRFALKVHRETKEVPAYALVLAKDGPKIKQSPSVPAGGDAADKVNVAIKGEDGFPVTPPGYSGLFVGVTPGHTRVKFIRYSIADFAKWTRASSKRPGVDRTGLTGVYDFYFEFANELGPRRTAEGEAPDVLDQAQDFSVALQTQLGLKLISDKTEIERLVIDHIDRTPSGN
jgi:uncharacterized protein (TIGR03435 family)